MARYQTEPYVIVVADVYGEAPHVGRGGWTWYTGSAGWMFRIAVESVLGVTLVNGESVRVKPHSRRLARDGLPGSPARRPCWRSGVSNPEGCSCVPSGRDARRAADSREGGRSARVPVGSLTGRHRLQLTPERGLTCEEEGWNTVGRFSGSSHSGM